MMINPENGYIYVSERAASKVRVFNFDANHNPPTLTELPFPPTLLTGESGCCYSLTFDASGAFLYSQYNTTTGSAAAIFSVSATGALTPVGSPINPDPGIMGFEPTGRFVYMYNGTGTALSVYSQNPSNGGLSKLPGGPFMINPSAGDLIIPGTF
jgi:6-phosphogluconolactonase (cycloisomerase 2 family)